MRILKPLPINGRDDTGLLLASTGDAILMLDRTPPRHSEYRFGQRVWKGTWSERDGRIEVKLGWEERWGENVFEDGPKLILARSVDPSRGIVFQRNGDSRFALVRFEVEEGMGTNWGTTQTYSVPMPYLERQLKRAD